MRKILIIVLPVLVLAVVIMLFTPVSYYLSREYRVTRYLKNYNININISSNLRVTSNVNKGIIETIEARPDRREVFLSSSFEVVMPKALRSDVLDIYNKMNGTNIQSLPSEESMLDDFIIYETQLIDFHGIENEFILPSGDLSMAAFFTVYTFYTRGDYREPVLAYILVTNWYGAPPDVLPIDMGKAEFAAYFDDLKTYYIELRKTQENNLSDNYDEQKSP